MLNNAVFSIFIGAALGFLAGLGVGGGSLLILWLTAVVGMEHQLARSINLLFFVPSAFIASLFRWHQGTLKIRTVLPAIISGCTCALLGTWLNTQIDIGLLKKLFGGLLIITGIRELLYRPRNAK